MTAARAGTINRTSDADTHTHTTIVILYVPCFSADVRSVNRKTWRFGSSIVSYGQVALRRS